MITGLLNKAVLLQRVGKGKVVPVLNEIQRHEDEPIS
jgi:hypothetical protein